MELKFYVEEITGLPQISIRFNRDKSGLIWNERRR